TLVIEPKLPNGFSIGINIIDITLRVELPEQQWEDIRVNVGSGNIALSDVAAAQLDLAAGSGNIEASRVAAGSLQLRSGSGNQRLEEVKAAGAVELAAGSGNVTVEGFEAGTLGVDAKSG